MTGGLRSTDPDNLRLPADIGFPTSAVAALLLDRLGCTRYCKRRIVPFSGAIAKEEENQAISNSAEFPSEFKIFFPTFRCIGKAFRRAHELE